MDKIKIDKAMETLKKYKGGKSNLEQRVIQSEQWFKMRYYKHIKDEAAANDRASAWLFNSIINKHADTLDNMPEPNILPRELSDTETAAALSEVVPVVLERNDFEDVYKAVDMAKLKQGTGIYGVFWDSNKLNGLGDIAVKQIDVLNLFWQPGVKDIQDSGNVFLVELWDNDAIISEYPALNGKLGAGGVEISKYVYDDNIDTSEKTPVIDWYYKVKTESKTVLHYAKIIAEECVYSSEDEGEGFYEHGLYPFVLDVLFADEGTPCGFGYIDVMKGTQAQIDMLDDNIIKYSKMATTPRYFINSSGSVNEAEFADWTKPFVHIDGSKLGADDLRPIDIPTLPHIYELVRSNKIEELKDTSANRDFAQGSTSSGVTAASAIVALQEAGSKQSRMRIKGNYRAYKDVVNLCIELIRQFYNYPRMFRIIRPNGEEEYTEFDNSGLKTQEVNEFGAIGDRLPVFDIDIQVQKSSPYAKQVQNELALQFYSMGFFNPENTDVSLAALNMMDFKGIDAVREVISSNGKMYDKLMELMQVVQQLATIVDGQNGSNIAQGIGQEQEAPAITGGVPASKSQSLVDKAKSRVADSTAPQ